MTIHQLRIGPVLLAVALLHQPAVAQQPDTATADVPPGHVRLHSTPGGGYFIAKALKDEYDRLVERTRLLREQVLRAEIDEPTARKEIAQLQTAIAAALAQIDEQKVLITAARVHTKSTTMRLELGPQRALCIVAGRVRIVGWDKPHVECRLEKTVLTLPDESPDADFEGLRVTHRHGPAPEIVGKSRAQWLANMGAAEDELSPIQRRIMEESLAVRAPMAPLQGVPIDVIEIEGLTGQQGNRQISIELKGPQGGSSSSQWRRHARLTVFVPKCRVIAVRGGREGVEVEDVAADLALSGTGDRDYAARSHVRGLQGSLTVQGVWVHEVRNVTENVKVSCAAFDGNGGMRYAGNSRTRYSGAAESLVFDDLPGDVDIRVTKANLALSDVRGRLSVKNEFGETTLTAAAGQVPTSCRIDSQAGAIRIRLPAAALQNRPTILLTECGIVQATGGRAQLEDRTFGVPSEPDHHYRSWKLLASPSWDTFTLLEFLRDVRHSPEAAKLIAYGRAGSIVAEFTP